MTTLAPVSLLFLFLGMQALFAGAIVERTVIRRMAFACAAIHFVMFAAMIWLAFRK